MCKNVQVITSTDNSVLTRLALEVLAIESKRKALESTAKALKSQMLELMKAQNLDKIEIEGHGEILKTLKEATLIFDSVALKKQDFEEYQKYLKVKAGCEYLTAKNY